MVDAPETNQAGGHRLAITEIGPLVEKITLKRELDFYETLAPQLERSHGLSLLGVWTPNYAGRSDAEPVEGKERLLLENLISELKRPNVLDVKLGTQFWDEDSSAEKKERMDRESARTTSSITGVRFTALQVWNNEDEKFEKVDKTYGKSITANDLPSALRKFFPIPLTSSSPLIPLVKQVHNRLTELLSLLEKLEIRIRGGSVLIVYEGDADALAAAHNEGRKAWDLRLIDFAHARPVLVSESGPDDGLLLGVNTLIRLTADWIKEVESL